MRRQKRFGLKNQGKDAAPSAWYFKIVVLIACLIVYAFSMVSPAVDALEQSGKPAAEEAEKLFAEKVQPVLDNICANCHGDSGASSGLDLRSRDGLLRGGSRGPAVVPGQSSKSLLVMAIEGTAELKMPLGQNQLPSEMIQAFRRWIDAGAPWPQKRIDAANEKQSGPVSDFWSFQPMKRYAVPSDGVDAAHVQTSVDGFLLKKMREKGLTPAPPADRVTLLRRAYFDLIGLPPTPEEVDAFVKDPLPTPKAFEKVVERLLASSRYGERWGRHWLDVVRYADTGGGSNDWERPNAWRYRDYVIRSFNQDKPYNQFILEQLAGDELDPNNPEHLIATGFLRMGPWEHTGMSVEAVTRQEWLDDVTHVTATAFLALTMNCARCHDHKFDPLPTKDYYRLQAVFATTHFEDRPAPFQPWENRNGFERERARVQQRLNRTQAKLDIVAEALGRRPQSASSNAQGPSQTTAAQKPSGQPAKELKRPGAYAENIEKLELERAYRKRVEILKRAVQRYEPLAYSVSSGELKEKKPAEEVFVLTGGSLSERGEKVTPGVPGALVKSDLAARSANDHLIPDTISGRRLALAKWIASPSNPLTARVMVNRIWQYHFGKGLVETSNNFGRMGKRPTHPELLDWLALYFIDKGWSVKAMHRVIMLSAAYQRSAHHPQSDAVAKADPENTLLTRRSPRRMEAEALRDGILVVAGELNLEAGGPPTFPEINEELAKQPRMIMGTVAPPYEPSLTRAERHRRTIYTFQQRNLINPFLEVFNGASLNESCERRGVTTVALQAFSLFNSQFVHDMALAFARRLETMTEDPAKQVELSYRLAFDRTPTEAERQRALEHIRAMTRHHETVNPAPPAPLKPMVQSINSEYSGETIQFEEESDIQNFERNPHSSQVPAKTRALAELCLVLFNANEFVYIY